MDDDVDKRWKKFIRTYVLLFITEIFLLAIGDFFIGILSKSI